MTVGGHQTAHAWSRPFSICMQMYLYVSTSQGEGQLRTGAAINNRPCWHSPRCPPPASSHTSTTEFPPFFSHSLPPELMIKPNGVTGYEVKKKKVKRLQREFSSANRSLPQHVFSCSYALTVCLLRAFSFQNRITAGVPCWDPSIGLE